MVVMLSQNLNAFVTLSSNVEKTVGVDTTPMEDGAMEDGMMEEGMMEEGTLGSVPKAPLLSHPQYVIGISVITFIIGSVIGVLLAKKKIKKGIELYED